MLSVVPSFPSSSAERFLCRFSLRPLLGLPVTIKTTRMLLPASGDATSSALVHFDFLILRINFRGDYVRTFFQKNHCCRLARLRIHRSCGCRLWFVGL